MGSVGRTEFLEEIPLCGAEEGCKIEQKLLRGSLYAGLGNGGRIAHHSLLLVSSPTLRSQQQQQNSTQRYIISCKASQTFQSQHMHGLQSPASTIVSPHGYIGLEERCVRVDSDWFVLDFLLTRCLARSRGSIWSARNNKPKADSNLIASTICMQISCWRLLYLVLQVDRMGGCAQFRVHLAPRLPLSLSSFFNRM